MQIQVKAILLSLFLFGGCNRLPYSPLKSGVSSDVKNECVGLWHIDDLSVKYLSEKCIREQEHIPPDEHFIWMFDDGRALVHCGPAFYDKKYGYSPSDEHDAYAEMYGAVTSVSTNSPKRFRFGAYGVWNVLERGKTYVNWRALNQPSEWYLGVDICAGGHGLRLYLGEDEKGLYLAVPIYVHHYGYLQDFIRLRKIGLPLNETTSSIEYPLINDGHVSDTEHFSLLTNQLHTVIKYGFGKRVVRNGVGGLTKYYIYDELFESNLILRGMDALEDVNERVFNMPTIQCFKNYMLQNFGVKDIAVIHCPTDDNGVRMKKQRGKEAFWITVVIPDDVRDDKSPHWRR